MIYLPSYQYLIKKYVSFFLGCTSKFDPIEGSWFVQKLCQVFREKACDTDLFQMMQLVSNQVSL